MKSWKLSAVVLSVVAIGAMGCGSSESTATTTSGTGGSKETSSTSTGSGGNGGAGGASTGTMASTGAETTGTSMTTGTAGTTGTGMSTSTGMSTGTGMATSSSSSTGTGGGTCAGATDCSLCKAQDKTCVECCGKANPDAQNKLIGFVIADCACPAASPCFTQCGGMGNTMPPVCSNPALLNQACASCLAGAGMNACVTMAKQSCVNDSVCKQLAICQSSCMGP